VRLNSLSTLLFVGTVILAGCGGGGSTSTDPILPETEIDKNVTITGDYQVESLGVANTINALVSIEGAAKSLYLVLSNNALAPASATITHSPKVVTTAAQAKAVLPANMVKKPVILHSPKYIQDFSSKISTLLSKAKVSQPQAKIVAAPERLEDNVGDSDIFYRSLDLADPTAATARKVISVKTDFGVKTLNIWVSNDSFDSGSGCDKSKCVKQTMVDALADTFLKLEDPDNGIYDNDIYDWVTNIYGEEWGNNPAGLIVPDDEISILLTDIDNDNSANGGVVGFFWPKDNFYKAAYTGSNERVMFYIDSVMFANGGSSWSIDDLWPKEIVSTLAHEFQHMIHFYQKTVLLANDNTDTWINEMLSESTEDLVATKIEHIGPRGVDPNIGSAGDSGNTLGRYPLFNANNTLSLTAWNNQFADYSKVSAFGAYLLRNYGGAKLLHDVMHNAFVDKQAVVDAVNKSPDGAGKTFANLLSEWGVAVMLSDHDNLLVGTPEYNTGWFTDTDSVYGDTTYEMGSINFFNYNPLPTIYAIGGIVQPEGNYYYKIGDNLTGDITIKLELNGQTEATLIAK